MGNNYEIGAFNKLRAVAMLAPTIFIGGAALKPANAFADTHTSVPCAAPANPDIDCSAAGDSIEVDTFTNGNTFKMITYADTSKGIDRKTTVTCQDDTVAGGEDSLLCDTDFKGNPVSYPDGTVKSLTHNTGGQNTTEVAKPNGDTEKDQVSSDSNTTVVTTFVQSTNITTTETTVFDPNTGITTTETVTHDGNTNTDSTGCTENGVAVDCDPQPPVPPVDPTKEYIDGVQACLNEAADISHHKRNIREASFKFPRTSTAVAGFENLHHIDAKCDKYKGVIKRAVTVQFYRYGADGKLHAMHGQRNLVNHTNDNGGLHRRKTRTWKDQHCNSHHRFNFRAYFRGKATADFTMGGKSYHLRNKSVQPIRTSRRTKRC